MVDRIISQYDYSDFKVVQPKDISEELKKSITKVDPVMVGTKENFKIYRLSELWSKLENINHKPIDAVIIATFHDAGYAYIKITF